MEKLQYSNIARYHYAKDLKGGKTIVMHRQLKQTACLCSSQALLSLEHNDNDPCEYTEAPPHAPEDMFQRLGFITRQHLLPESDTLAVKERSLPQR